MPTVPLTDAECLEMLDLVNELGRVDLAAKHLGMAYSTAYHRYKAGRQRGLHLSDGIKTAVNAANLVPGEAKHGWAKVEDEDGNSHSVFWKKPNEEPEKILDALRAGLADLAPPKKPVVKAAPTDLMALFPVADLHMGLLTDEEEVGEDWNTKKAQEVFQDTFGRLIEVTPAAETALLAQLGDLMHNDDQRNVTPQNKHQLDVDTRYFMILRRAVAVMKWAIEALRGKYKKVIYCGRRGNHDMTAHYAVTLALAEYYRGAKDVEIIESANEFYVHEFGLNMNILHHGDKAKPERLAHFAAAQWPEIWGRTKHRTSWSGHVHHTVSKEVGGMTFESTGTIIPRDAHAFGSAYSAKRGLVSVVYHATQGEVTRARIGL